MRDDRHIRRLGKTSPLFVISSLLTLWLLACTPTSEIVERTPIHTATPEAPSATMIAPPTATQLSGDSLVVEPSPTATLVPTAVAQPTTAQQDTDKTPSFFLDLLQPTSLELIVNEPDLIVGGKTVVDAVVTVNDDIVVTDSEGLFGALVTLDPGPNLIEVVGSVLSGESKGLVITAVYLP